MPKNPDFNLVTAHNYFGISFTGAMIDVVQEQNVDPTKSYRLVLHIW